MPQVTRLGDKCTGHPNGFPPRASTSANPKVSASGKRVVCVGDSYAPHSNGSSTHPGTATVGSPKVLASGKQRMRVGDQISCGSKVAEGTPKVLIG